MGQDFKTLRKKYIVFRTQILSAEVNTRVNDGEFSENEVQGLESNCVPEMKHFFHKTLNCQSP